MDRGIGWTGRGWTEAGKWGIDEIPNLNRGFDLRVSDWAGR